MSTTDARDLVARSKHLSWLLRHGAVEAGLAMDPAGWADVADVLARTKMTRAQLEEAVRTNTKGRLQQEGDRVRACQGHSQANTGKLRRCARMAFMAIITSVITRPGTTPAANR